MGNAMRLIVERAALRQRPCSRSGFPSYTLYVLHAMPRPQGSIHPRAARLHPRVHTCSPYSARCRGTMRRMDLAFSGIP
eukprot:scaffold1280_cov379-Prasinococcus_capsulatus_cf.AAC.25